MKDVIVADGDLVIRPVRDHTDDHERLAAWRNSPHVKEWWDPDEPEVTADAVASELAPRAGDELTASCIIELRGEPVGFIQFYPWDIEQQYLAEIGVRVPEGSWGLDIFVGDPALIGTGVGSRTVRLLSDHLFAEGPATAVALITEAGNARAHTAYTRAGMRVSGLPFLDTDTRGGQRVESILMIRERPGENSWRAMISRWTSDAPS